MCSNTNGSRGGDLECSASVLRKQKRQRIPKRGPGVAELEKILREQENKNDSGNGLISPFVSTPKNLTFSKDNKHFIIPVTGIYGTGNGNVGPNVSVGASSQLAGTGSGRNFSENHLIAPSLPRLATANGGGASTNCNCNCNLQLDGGGGGNGGRRGVDMAGSAVISPGNHYFRHFHPATALYNSTGNARSNSQSIQRMVDVNCPKTVSDPPFPVNFRDQNQMLQKKFCQHQPSMMNYYRNPALSSAPTSSSAEFYQHHVEPPSNQRFHQNHTSTLQEEDIKITGIKRQRPFPPSIPPPPAFHGQFPSFPSQMQRLDPSILGGNHGAFNVGTTSTSRDRFQSSNMEHNMRKANASYGTSNGNNGIIFGSSPTTISSSMQNCQQELFKVKPFPSQELVKEKESYEGPRPHQGSVPEGPGSRKPFFSFLQPEEEMTATDTRPSLNERRETREDVIDLNLKL